ncbi:MAG: asparagine synthase (glutamine-hydrolyzing) [Betaproteobacteria bacterium]|nr:asparagine synthase (glutamine-hydrolyzing) [Betaproteobacteria bacterium]
MCGLSGYIVNTPPSYDGMGVLQQMNRRLAHRGPDAEGYYQDGPAYLGHRRLAVIDLEASRQPMTTADGRTTLVFNGELYNFKTLRQELQALGRHFKTAGDTEVCLQAIAEWGAEALQKMQGMFAFACWDSQRQTLFAARDHLGVKPLYYHWDGKLLAFASELKALLAHPDIPQRLNLDALGLFLECQYIPTPLSIYQDIHKLPAGHSLTLTQGEMRIAPYWQPDYTHKLALTEAEAVERLDHELRQSVASMMVADVPLGAFLSGGIDSSLVAAIMQAQSRQPIDTFNLGFQSNERVNDTTQSEHQQAAQVAQHLGCRHHALMVRPDDVLAAFDDWVAIFDEPFGDQAALPTLLLSRLTRQHVTVALTGEGADELFSGYSNYRKRVREERFAHLLGARYSPLKALYPHLPPSWQKDRVIKAIGLPQAMRYATIPNVFDRATHRGLFSDALLAGQRTHIADYAARHYEACNASDYLEKIMYVDTRLWLPDDLLTKVDRATMAYSLEARVPYLDHRFVEFVAKLDPALKQHGKTTKYLLKKLAEKYLPREIIYRPKQGFVMPLSPWLEGGLKSHLEQSLGEAGLAKRGLFRPGALTRLLAEHRAGRSNHAGRLWALTVLERWFDHYQPDFSL